MTTIDSDLVCSTLGVTRMYVPTDLVREVQAFIVSINALKQKKGRPQAVLADYMAGLSLKVISEKHGISPQGVSNIVRRHGGTLRRNRKPSKPSKPSKWRNA